MKETGRERRRGGRNAGGNGRRREGKRRNVMDVEGVKKKGGR